MNRINLNSKKMPETGKPVEQTLSDEDKKERIYNLRKLVKEDDNHSNVQIDDKLLERFLYSEDFNVGKAFERIKSFYTMLVEYPDWYAKEGPVNRKKIIEEYIRMTIPHKDKEGRPIYIAKNGNCDVNKMTLLDVAVVDDIFLEFIAISEPLVSKTGICVIIDMERYNWRLLKWLAPEYVKIGTKKLQSLPFKEWRYHVVNNSFIVNVAIKLVWPFLPEYIKKMVTFHFSGWESLHQHIDKEILPVEYGGLTQYDYNDIYKTLYERNDDIVENFKKHRYVGK